MGTNADEGSLFLPVLLEIVPGVRLPLTTEPETLLFNTAFAIDPPIKGCWVKLTLCGK